VTHYVAKTKIAPQALVLYVQDATARLNIAHGIVNSTMNITTVDAVVTSTWGGQTSSQYRWLVGRALGDLDIQMQKVTGTAAMTGNAVNTWIQLNGPKAWGVGTGIPGSIRTVTGWMRFRSNSTQQEITAANVAWSLTAENTGTSTGCPTCCFTPDTLITMADGTTKRIADVMVGDMILGYDMTIGGRVPVAVTEIIVREYTRMYEIEFADGRVLKASEDHPIYVRGKGFASINPTVDYKDITVPAKIAVGDFAIDQNDTENEILSITEMYYPWEVYTFANPRFYANGMLVY